MWQPRKVTPRNASDPSPTLVASHHIDEIHEQGFTVVPDVIDAAQVAALKSAVSSALEADADEHGHEPAKLPYFVVELLHRDPVFGELLDNPVLHEVLDAVLGPDSLLYCMSTANMPPATHIPACDIHTDQTFFIPGGYCARVMMTLALDDFTEHNGATFHLPGSHHLEERPSDEDFFARAVRVERKAGDAVFFNCRNWHAGALNHTDTERFGISLQAARPFLKQRFDYPNWDMPDVVGALTPRARRFLGVDATPPASQQAFYERGRRMADDGS